MNACLPVPAARPHAPVSLRVRGAAVLRQHRGRVRGEDPGARRRRARREPRPVAARRHPGPAGRAHAPREWRDLLTQLPS